MFLICRHLLQLKQQGGACLAWNYLHPVLVRRAQHELPEHLVLLKTSTE